MKPTVLCVVALMTIAGGPAPISAADSPPTETWEQAVAAIGLPNGAAPGRQQYGYTRISQYDAFPKVSGWWRIVKQGTTPYWRDANRDGKKDPEEIKSARYCLWFDLTGTETQLDQFDAKPDADGVYPLARRYFDARRPSRPVTGIAQAAIVVPPTESEPGVSCLASEGLLFASCHIRIGFDIEDAPDSWIRSTRPDDIRESTEAFPEREALLAMYRSALVAAEAESVRVTGEMVAAWRRWLQVRVAGGSGLKGLFVRSPSWIPGPAELPRGLKPEGDASNPRFVRKEDQPRTEGDKTWTATIEERYEVGIPVVGQHTAKQNSVDAPLSFAKDDYERVLRNNRKDFTDMTAGSGSFTGPEVVNLAGADAAARFRSAPLNIGGTGQHSWYRSMEVVVFRIANVVAVIRGTYTGRGTAAPAGDAAFTPQTLPVAAIVLQKILASGQADKPAENTDAILTLTASVTQLWADGAAQSALRLSARTLDGRPLAAEFALETEGGGKLSADKATTGPDGTVTLTYTASTRPGEATVMASGRGSFAVAKINEGGLVLQPADARSFGALADGKSSVSLIAVCTDPTGQPVKDLAVRFSANEQALPVTGRLEPASATTDENGRARVTYTAPQLGLESGIRLADVTVTATAAIPGTARELRSAASLHVYAGEVAYVEASKPGYAAGVRFPVQIPQRNATVKGVLASGGPDSERTPVAFAKVRLVDPAGHASAEVVTAPDGSFTARLVGDPTSGQEGSVELREPLLLPLDPDLANRLGEARAALKQLAATGHEVRDAAGYLARWPAQLAASQPGHADPAHSTEYAVNVLPRVAWMCLYTRLIADRQMESTVWFMESVEPAIQQLSELLGAIDALEKAAKDKLGEHFDAKVWRNLKQTVAGRFLRQLNVWHYRHTRPLRKAYKDLEKVGDATGNEDPAGVRDLLQLLAAPKEAATDKLQELSGTDDVAGKFRVGLKAAITRLLRDNMDTAMRTARERVLADGATRATRGEVTVAPPEGAAARALELFTTFEKEHQALNIANLDRELYRLDASLFMNTVVKGVFLYQNLAGLFTPEGLASIRALDREKLTGFQESASSATSTVDTAAATLDSAFGAYKGLAWLDDLNRASELHPQLDGILLPPP
jgi:hypothetical protein